MAGQPKAPADGAISRCQRSAIDFVAEESVYLGRLWYPWETYGRYTFSEMILIPDLLEGIGMSTLRVTRFLMMELRKTPG